MHEQLPTQPPGRPLPHGSGKRLGVISNPNSGRNRSQIAAVCKLLESAQGVRHIVTDSCAAIESALVSMARDGIDVIAINGGDGSVAHVLTVLHSCSPFGTPPLLCAIPGGTTNVTVGDIGIRGGLTEAILLLLGWLHSGNPQASVVERPVIGVTSSAGQLLGCGLVFGAGAVVDGIEYWQEQVRSRGMRSELSSGVAMVRTLWGMIHDHDGFDESLRIGIDGSGNERIEGEFMLLVISALERLFLGIHPFWGGGTGLLHFTAIERRAPRFARALPSLLRGKATRYMSSSTGYHSSRLDSVRLDFNSAFTLDGELHHPAAGDAPMTVALAGKARFLRI
jgi:diacylglycerol kinase (ATP)